MMNHNDFPKMTEEFDRSVRRALDSLPERESKPVRRFSAKKIVCAGLAAALCIGGTAFAANAQSWFPLLFPNGGDANLEGYVQTADNAKLTDENDSYRLSVESVLFDESAGTGVISLHLARWNTYCVCGGTDGLCPPTPSIHRLRRGLPGYLILFAPHAFEPERQLLSSKPPSPLVFFLISTHFTATLGIPLASPAL